MFASAAGLGWPPSVATGSPVGTTCAGWSSEGLPVGIQVVGRRLDDMRVVSVLAYLEQLLDNDRLAPV